MPEIRVTPAGIVINFAGIGPLPDALYHVTVRTAEQRQSSNGNDMVVLTLEVLEGDFTGRRLKENVVLLPQCQFATDRVLRALRGEAHRDGDVPSDWDELVGRDCTVFVSPAERDGRIYDDIREWLPAMQDAGAPPAPGQGPRANGPF
jgi:hypothetical protein